MKKYFDNGLDAYNYAVELGLPLLGKEFTEMSSIEHMACNFKERVVVGIRDGAQDRDYVTGAAFLREDTILSNEGKFYVYQLSYKNRIFDLLPLSQIPLSSQLERITEDSFGVLSFKNLIGKGLNPIGHIVHIKSGAVFNVPGPAPIKVVEPD